MESSWKINQMVAAFLTCVHVLGLYTLSLSTVRFGSIFEHFCLLVFDLVTDLERLACRCDTPDAIAAWTSKQREYRAVRRQKCEEFWRAKVEAEKSSPRQLWRSIDVLLGRSSAAPCDDISADEFHRFFDDKVAGVRSATADSPPVSFQTMSPVAPLDAFQPVSASDVVTTVRALPDKSCSLDVLPTRLLKAVIDTIAPFVTELFTVLS